MSTVKSKKLQVGTDASASNNFTIYQPSTPDGTLRIGVGNADSPTEVGQFNANGYKPTTSPLMRATMTTNQSTNVNVATKINFDVSAVDTTSDYDTTNKRWTPSVAGYYHIYITIHPDMANQSGNWWVRIYKNGSGQQIEYTMSEPQLNQNQNCRCSGILYMNGSTDYVEAFMSQNVGTRSIYAPSIYTYFEGHLIQQA